MHTDVSAYWRVGDLLQIDGLCGVAGLSKVFRSAGQNFGSYLSVDLAKALRPVADHFDSHKHKQIDK